MKGGEIVVAVSSATKKFQRERRRIAEGGGPVASSRPKSRKPSLSEECSRFGIDSSTSSPICWTGTNKDFPCELTPQQCLEKIRNLISFASLLEPYQQKYSLTCPTSSGDQEVKLSVPTLRPDLILEILQSVYSNLPKTRFNTNSTEGMNALIKICDASLQSLETLKKRISDIESKLGNDSFVNRVQYFDEDRYRHRLTGKQDKRSDHKFVAHLFLKENTNSDRADTKMITEIVDGDLKHYLVIPEKSIAYAFPVGTNEYESFDNKVASFYKGFSASSDVIKQYFSELKKGLVERLPRSTKPTVIPAPQYLPKQQRRSDNRTTFEIYYERFTQNFGEMCRKIRTTPKQLRDRLATLAREIKDFVARNEVDASGLDLIYNFIKAQRNKLSVPKVEQETSLEKYSTISGFLTAFHDYMERVFCPIQTLVGGQRTQSEHPRIYARANKLYREQFNVTQAA